MPGQCFRGRRRLALEAGWTAETLFGLHACIAGATFLPYLKRTGRRVSRGSVAVWTFGLTL